MKRIRLLLSFLFLGSLPSAASAAAVMVKAVNHLQISRPSQTIELSGRDLAPLGAKDLGRIHVKDAQGKELLCQAVDTDGDYRPDEVIFQADFAPGETRNFLVSTGRKWEYSRSDFRAYGRFVRERFDDFAWENDRIAHRTYGKALETWKGEPLTSSAIDVWVKKAPRLVLNDWYMMDHYHTDTGEGADFYPAGPSRGCGGSGLWAAKKLWVSRNFVDSRVLACGPIRVMFELTYPPFEVNGIMVSEVKRISLDAGQNLDHFQSYYRAQQPAAFTAGIGIKKSDVVQHDLNKEHGWLASWEPLKADRKGSHLGCAVIVDSKLLQGITEDDLNLLVLEKAPPESPLSYWAGFGWDGGGQFSDYAAWKTYVDQFAQGLLSPLQVSIVPG